MKPENLEVGKLYRCGDNKCLAVGMRKLFTGNGYTEKPEWLFKHLVIVDNYDMENIGFCIQEGDNAMTDLWETIEEWKPEFEQEIIENNPNQGLFIAFMS